jgi:stage IV sporulation protein FB
VFLSEPPPTRADLNFGLLGFPIRVHPSFWLVTALMAWRPGSELSPQLLLLWVIAVFVSIVIHELGHAWMARLYGAVAYIVLYSFGGLAIYRPQPRSVWNRIAIAFAGPGAGFLFAGLIAGVLRATGRRVDVQWDWVPFDFDGFEDMNLTMFVWYLLSINCYWGLFNLLPIFPLDGGQISRNLFMHFDWRDGFKKSLWLSVIVAVGLAVYVFRENGNQLSFTVLMLGYLAFLSFRELNPHRFNNPW